jgi:hypothetical protein
LVSHCTVPSLAVATGTSTVATSTDYLYSGSSLLATIDQKLVNGTATGAPITRYVHPDNLAVSQVLGAPGFAARARLRLAAREMFFFSAHLLEQ